MIDVLYNWLFLLRKDCHQEFHGGICKSNLDAAMNSGNLKTQCYNFLRDTVSRDMCTIGKFTNAKDFCSFICTSGTYLFFCCFFFYLYFLLLLIIIWQQLTSNLYDSWLFIRQISFFWSVNYNFLYRREHYYGYSPMAKNQSDSCNFIYLMIILFCQVSFY